MNSYLGGSSCKWNSPRLRYVGGFNETLDVFDAVLFALRNSKAALSKPTSISADILSMTVGIGRSDWSFVSLTWLDWPTTEECSCVT